MADSTTIDTQKQQALLLSLPLWVRLCCNVAPMASIVVFLAVSIVQKVYNTEETLYPPAVVRFGGVCGRGEVGLCSLCVCLFSRFGLSFS